MLREPEYRKTIPMKRIILSVAAIAALLAVPTLADARPMKHHRAAHHAARHARGAAKAPAYRGGDSGSAAVDALNAQSLARARGTAQ